MSFSDRKGFALPTVLMVSIVMLTILVSAVASTSAVRVALLDQYYNQLSQQAVDAGITYAKACIANNGGTPQWTDVKPLKPSTDCAGNTLSGLDCIADPRNSACSIITVDSNVIISFSVPAPLPNSAGEFTNISATGSVSLLRSSDNSVWRQYSYTSKTSQTAQSVAGVEASWKQISNGHSHTCAIASNDQAYCWGNNGNGRLGDGTTINRSSPVAVGTSGVLSGLTIKMIAAGSNHTCAIASNNQAYCWGYNFDGELGDNTTVSKSNPVAVHNSGALSGLTVKSISAFTYQTCVVASNNLAYCWGQNYYGQLGDNTTVKKTTPTPVYTAGVLSGLTINSIAPGGSHTCAIASNNLVYCWGYNNYGQLGDNTTVNKSVPTTVLNSSGALKNLTIKKTTAGNSHSCVIASNDKAYCWGYNTSGQLGDNTIVNKSVPTAVLATGVLNGLTLTSISAGGSHTCAIASNSKAYCWGQNDYGQLGDNTMVNKSAPVAVLATGVLNGLTITLISSGNLHSCVLASDNQSYCWGSNEFGQSGDGSVLTSSTPLAVYTGGALAGLSVKSISGGSTHACVIASNNLVYCWGDNTYGQLGDNTTVGKTVPTAIYMAGALNGLTIKSVSVGYYHTCVIASNNKAYCWGLNTNGRLGDNTTVNKSVATAVYSTGALSGLTIKSIAAGGVYTCAIASNNSAYCWGNNNYGQLGDNTIVAKSVPTAVYTAGALSGLTISAISSGNNQACAIASNNLAYCWGYNNSGRLGDNTTVNKSVPTAVYTAGVLSGLTMKTISIGNSQTCATASNNLAYCWGYNYEGELGDNTTVNKSVPTAVNTSGVLNGLTVLSTSGGGYSHACAIASNNLAYCWGGNSYGQLGDNTIINKSVPTAVSTDGVLSGKTIQSIVNGDFFTCVVTVDSQAYCWGQNSLGQLGVSNKTIKNLVPIGTKRITISGSVSDPKWYTY